MIASQQFTWTDDYSVGIPAIDEQHKTLVELLNQLHLAVVEHHGKATAREVLERVEEYTHSHFQLEERLMSLSRYPDYEAHLQQHRALVEHIATLRRRLYDENQPIAFELLYVLKKWLLQHINESDKRFGAHFAQARQHADSAPPADGNGDLGARRGKWWAR